MTSPDVAMLGAQHPRLSSWPAYSNSSGQEAIELAAHAGLELDPWQQLVLTHALGERSDGHWSAFEVGVMVSRQNGKGTIIEARELAGLFLLGERLIVHSAHQFDTSLEAFRRLLELIEGTPDLLRRVRRISRSHGEEGIELKTGQRIRFRTRTKGGGRGFTSDCLILDEAMFIEETAHGALLPTLSARPNPQVWYCGSAVDEEVHDHGIPFARLRERGVKGDDAVAYFEWSVDAQLTEVDETLATDREAWAEANPGLGIRIAPDYIANEQRGMDPRTFAVERLGIGSWPQTAGGQQVIDMDVWQTLADPASEATGRVRFAVDVTPRRDRAAIAMAGQREDGLLHVEIVESRQGTGWVADRVAELVSSHNNADEVVCDAAGPAASLIPDLEAREVTVRAVTASEHARACGLTYDMIDQRGLRHRDTAELKAALKGAVTRPLGDAWAWSRKSSTLDISPLVAATLAIWATANAPMPSIYETRGVLVI